MIKMGQKSAGRGPVSATAYDRAIRSSHGTFAWVLGFSAMINILMLTGSLYMLQVYDRVLTSGSVPTLIGLFAVVVLLYLFLAFYDALRARLLGRIAARLDIAISEPAFRAMLTQRDGEPRNPLRDVDTVRGFVGSPALQGLFDLPFVPLFLMVLFIVHPLLGYATLAGAVVGLALAFVTRKLTQELLAKAQEFETRARNFAEQGGRSADLVRALGMTGHVARRWRRQHHEALSAGQEASDPAEVLQAVSRSFRMLLQSAILTIGAWLVLRGEISAGSIIAGSILSGRALAPIDQAVGQLSLFGKVVLAHRRLMAFFGSAEASPTYFALPRPTGRLQVQQVTRLAPMRPGVSAADRPQILSRVSFDLEPGDGLGVVGNSASGKSTLARVLVGALTPDLGAVLLDGAPLSQWDPEALGAAIGYLPQEVEMIPGTIRDNIARFDTSARDAEVIEAAQLAGVHDMIVSLPQGYMTLVGGPDDPLSGGQRQRVGLARALFRKPAFVVLDEPNANLDPAGEAALTRALNALREGGATVIVMAHRPSALAAMNKIMVLHGGKAIQFGNKEDLVAMPTTGAKTRLPQTGGGLARDDGMAPEMITELPSFVLRRKLNKDARAATAPAASVPETAEPAPLEEDGADLSDAALVAAKKRSA